MIAATPAVCAAQAPSVERIVDSLVAVEALSRGVPGVAVAVVADGQVVLARGYGRIALGSSQPVTPTTTFNIASITKPLTAALVLMLEAEGRLHLDSTANRYLTLPPQYRTLTVRQLLTHTSGIARDLRRDNDDDPDAAEYRRRLDASTASSKPGTRFEYSNTGYTVLGWLVENVEGRPLADVLERRIFSRLGMHQAGYRKPLDSSPNRARPHDAAGGTPRASRFVSGGFGSGGVSLSAADFAALGVALQNGTLLPREVLDRAWTAGKLADGSPSTVRLNSPGDGYGFGWFITRVEDRRLLTHGGAITGFSANLYHFPDERLTIAVLANAKGRDDGAAPVDPLARSIARACLRLTACRR
jgi:CubicO group peptidase (beta-lactamase class C family)